MKCPSDALRTWAHLFAPAEPETAGEPEGPCINSGGCRYLAGSHCAHGCREAADAVTRLGQEMEPACDGCDHAPHADEPCPCGHEAPEPEAPESDDSWHDASPCDGCGHFVLDHNDGACKALWCLCGHPVPRPGSPRRPPYAVAYALASGELYEVALSGDAVATVEDGVLKVSHPAGVAYIVQVKPLEGP